MNSFTQFPAIPDDDLLNLEINIARRADAIAEGTAGDRQADLARWLQAERELCSPGQVGAAILMAGKRSGPG